MGTLGIHFGISRSKFQTLKKNVISDIIGAWLDRIEPTEGLLAYALEMSGYQRIATKLRGKQLQYYHIN